MRFLLLTASLLLAACNTWDQAVVAPCVGKPATGALGECPPCSADSDCKLLSNACDQSAYCVHKDSSWKPNTNNTCAETEKYLESRMPCVCLAGVCDWHSY